MATLQSYPPVIEWKFFNLAAWIIVKYVRRKLLKWIGFVYWVRYTKFQSLNVWIGLRRGRVAYECLFSFVELYFLISRFLGAGPCKKAAQVNMWPFFVYFRCCFWSQLTEFHLFFQVLREEVEQNKVSKLTWICSFSFQITRSLRRFLCFVCEKSWYFYRI